MRTTECGFTGSGGIFDIKNEADMATKCSAGLDLFSRCEKDQFC